MRHQFVHVFEDDPPLGDFDVDLALPPGAQLCFDANGGDVWISANRAGWLHLARICAEMGSHTNFRPGYHFHRSYDWSESPAPGREVSLELSEDRTLAHKPSNDR